MNIFFNRMCSVWVSVFMVGCLSTDMKVQAASFDCAKASTKVEHMVCDEPELSKLDEKMAAAYKVALQDEKQAAATKQGQRERLKERDKCVDIECVQEAYRERIGQFQSSQNTIQPTEILQQAAPSNVLIETACPAPKIDWRSYQWGLITGKGEAACEEMLTYLKSRPNHIAPPTCTDERLPKNGNWTRPEVSILSEEERQAILRDVPERWRQKLKAPVSHEKKIELTKLLRVVRGDITRDGIPESFLAYGLYEDSRLCEQSRQCVRTESALKGRLVLVSDAYDLLPMNDEGSQVNWSHRTVRSAPILMGGELIYYKGLPYWMSRVNWDQESEDRFPYKSSLPDDPYSAIFGLNGLGHSVIGQYGGEVKPAPFSEVKHIRGDGPSCRFGYFHRDNLKQNPPKGDRS